jgi:hypothetical protein
MPGGRGGGGKQGDNKDAIENYHLDLAIMERLASINPKSQHWQAVLVEYNYDLAINGDDAARRFAYVAAGLEKLQAVRKLTAEQAGWLAHAKTRCRCRGETSQAPCCIPGTC